MNKIAFWVYIGILLGGAMVGYAAGEGASILAESKVSGLSTVRDKLKGCSQQYQFYTDSGCKPLDLSGLPVNSPIPTGIRITLGFNETTSYNGSGTCISASYSCNYSCPRSSWVTIVGGHIQPYYCQASGSTSNSASCSDMAKVENGTGNAILNAWATNCLAMGNAQRSPLSTPSTAYVNNTAITPSGPQTITKAQEQCTASSGVVGQGSTGGKYSWTYKIYGTICSNSSGVLWYSYPDGFLYVGRTVYCSNASYNDYVCYPEHYYDSLSWY